MTPGQRDQLMLICLTISGQGHAASSQAGMLEEGSVFQLLLEDSKSFFWKKKSSKVNKMLEFQ
uniref:Uncharacterized protein n=1 Tax=Junco hyemalis TaxID=40217 RepID=A0A8C5J9R8_JUNHY